jgi:hypothetical protein
MTSTDQSTAPRRWVFTALIFVLAAARIHLQQRTAEPNTRSTSDFRVLDNAFWQGPWVFSAGRNGAVAHLHNTMEMATNGPIPIRLDDRSTGTLRVEAAPCNSADECPDDCGCFANDSYWIDVADSKGRNVSHLHLWAAYGVFDIVPIDLIGGPGDELMIIRIPQHASPAHGPDLKIWKLSPKKPVDLLARDDKNWKLGSRPIDLDTGDAVWFPVAGPLRTVDTAVSCADWRAHLFVSSKDAKPRSIALRADFATADPSGCQLSADGADQAAVLRQAHMLRFEGGAYRMR